MERLLNEAKGGMRLGHSGICRYCGGKIRVVPAEQIYGKAAAERLNLQTSARTAMRGSAATRVPSVRWAL
mgnify:CR=1 FL=1